MALISIEYLPGASAGKRQPSLDGDLVACLLHLFRRFLELQHLLGTLFHGELESSAGLVRLVVRLEVVNLEIDSQAISGGEVAVEARPHFGGTQERIVPCRSAWREHAQADPQE